MNFLCGYAILYATLYKEKKMKFIKLCSLILCMLLLLPICTSCVWERHNLLYEIEQKGMTFCVRGKGARVKQIVVKQNGKAVWSKAIKTDKEMGKIDDAYGLLIQDLNFDGFDDILIAVAKDGDCVSYECYLRQGLEPQYKLHEELSSMYNVRANAELRAIFAFEQSTEELEESIYVTCDKAVKYLWNGKELVPDMYSALYQISNSLEEVQKPYRWALAYYDEELGDFLDSDDVWLTEEEYQAKDWSFLYYFR